jgi:hypothetical protein
MPEVILKFEWEQFKLIFVTIKAVYFRICGNLKSAENNCVRKSKIRKSPQISGPQIANPQISTFAEDSKVLKIRKLADLRFVELICGPPTFYIFTIIFGFLSLTIKMLIFSLYYLRFIFIFHVFLTKSVGFKYFFIRSFYTNLVFCLPTIINIRLSNLGIFKIREYSIIRDWSERDSMYKSLV